MIVIMWLVVIVLLNIWPIKSDFWSMRIRLFTVQWNLGRESIRLPPSAFFKATI